MSSHRSSTPLPYAQPRYDRTTLRRSDASGGPPESGRVRGSWGRIERVGGPVFANPSTAVEDRRRGPYWRVGNMRPPADPIRWTDAGPIRTELHMDTFTWRRWSGGSHQDREGWHTGTPLAMRTTRTAGSNKPRIMKRPRQNRLTQQRYRGQTYSATTQVIGGSDG
ncbi:hypothetical protein ABT072_08410 [Streptomyces sp. NPDC002589]|uniref:hypothetical protein n=1 Tax=Streptomyces sp. NPDC002589 TaxID=3154420 RepID=UPI00331EC042